MTFDQFLSYVVGTCVNGTSETPMTRRAWELEDERDRAEYHEWLDKVGSVTRDDVAPGTREDGNA